MSTTAWWVIGFAVGGAVVLVAATLLIAIVALARRIVRQAGEITEALDGARENTNALFEIASTNHAIEQITRGLQELRHPTAQRGQGLIGRVVEHLTPGSEGR